MNFTSYKYWLNEKFTDESDPVQDLGIGIKSLIEKWLAEHKIVSYTLDKNLFISAEKSVTIHLDDNCTELPRYIKFKTVNNAFYINNYQNLTTLRGCPEKVGGFFSCNNCNLKSLKYSPKKARDFVCWHDNDFRHTHKNITYFTYEDVLKVCNVTGYIYDDIGQYEIKLKKYIDNWGMKQ